MSQKPYFTFEESLRQPYDSLINFEYIMTHPEAKYIIWEKFRFDTTFKNRINERILTDQSFKLRWFKYFGSFYRTLTENQETKVNKPAIKALVKKF